MPAPTDRALGLLDDILKTDQPANVDRASVTLTGEGPEEAIVLIPHRDLGGYSLVLWFSDDRLDVGWASVLDLTYHDELDLGTVVARLKDSDWLADQTVSAVIRAELSRPISVRVRRTPLFRRRWLRCAVEVSGRWIETGVGPVASDVPDSVTSLQGPQRPAVHSRVPIEEWHRFAEPAWPREAAT